MHRKGLVSDIVTRTAVAAALLLTLPFSGIAGAEAPSGDLPGVSLKLYFYRDYSTYDSLFMDNGRRLEEFVRRYGLSDPDGPRISVSCSASAEGPYMHNEELSLKRVARICGILEDSYGIPSYRIDRDARGIDWDDLLQQVRTASGLSQREKRQVTDIITSVPEHTFGTDGKLTDSRRKRLMDLNGGRTWTWMLDSIFYEQRYGMVTVSEPAGIAPALRDTVYVREDHYYYYHDTVTAVPVIQPVAAVGRRTSSDSVRSWMQDDPRYQRRKIFALRTNLLLPLMNVGVEVPVGNRWSVGLDHYYPWIWRNTSSNESCTELMLETAEARYWLGRHHSRGSVNWKNRLLGHSVGVFGVAGYYDFERDWNGRQGEFWGAGVDYMFAFPVFGGRMHMELELGVGYLSGSYEIYDVYTEGGQLFRRRDEGRKGFTYMGPLKAGVSLVLPIYKDRKTANTVTSGEVVIQPLGQAAEAVSETETVLETEAASEVKIASETETVSDTETPAKGKDHKRRKDR